MSCIIWFSNLGIVSCTRSERCIWERCSWRYWCTYSTQGNQSICVLMSSILSYLLCAGIWTQNIYLIFSLLFMKMLLILPLHKNLWNSSDQTLFQGQGHSCWCQVHRSHIHGAISTCKCIWRHIVHCSWTKCRKPCVLLFCEFFSCPLPWVCTLGFQSIGSLWFFCTVTSPFGRKKRILLAIKLL